jgi:4-hydroxybenzoate polyprenyltransferase
MPHDTPRRSIETTARRIKRKKLIVWAVRQMITVALAIWLFPNYPWLWWALIFVVPLALFSLYQILRVEEVAQKGPELDNLLRQIGEA